MKIKFVGVPIVWCLLILPLAMWFHNLHENYIQFYIRY
jgi:hypothetical protein